MSRRHACFVLLSLALVGCQPDPGAKLGDPAAPLRIRKWVKGQSIDDERGTAKGYLQAYAQRSIPTAFIVDKAGKVVWFGHPLTDLEATLTAMVTPVSLR